MRNRENKTCFEGINQEQMRELLKNKIPTLSDFVGHVKIQEEFFINEKTGFVFYPANQLTNGK